MKQLFNIKNTAFHLDDQEPNAARAKKQLAFFSYIPDQQKDGSIQNFDWTIHPSQRYKQKQSQSLRKKDFHLPPLKKKSHRIENQSIVSNKSINNINKSIDDLIKEPLRQNLTPIRKKKKERILTLPLHINSSMFRKKKATVISAINTVDLSFSCLKKQKPCFVYNQPSVKGGREVITKKSFDNRMFHRGQMVQFREQFKKLEDLLIRQKKVVSYFFPSCQL